MFFRRLDLQGFKSFAHKTSIEFLPGITIVVGPNGCGKSNVVDGIKWVLGETSAKSLRGGKMGDVVFRGTQALKAAGYAHVTLTLDNESRIVKLDQTELSVGRRLFSSGESEYLLNKQACRMRDVHELFMDTGLGADGYAIIEQGRIGQMVEAKPEQRRELFEEAAGISLYKARREETLRKLVRTEEDLLRLFDIVSEVERNCNSLRRQARKAERHQHLRRRLRRLQQRLIVLRHGALSGSSSSVAEAHRTARDAFEQASARHAQAEAAHARFQSEAEELGRRLQETQQYRHALQSELARERHHADMAAQKSKAIDERRGMIGREIDSANARAQVLGSTLGALQDDLARQSALLAESDQSLAEHQRRYDLLRRDVEAANQQGNRLRAELATMRRTESTLQNDSKVAEALVAKLNEELRHAEEAERQLVESAGIAEAEAAAARERVEHGKAQVADLAAKLRETHADIKAAGEQREELGRKLETLTREINHAASRVQALQELEDSYEGYFLGVKEVMQASKKGQLEGIIGVVTNLLGVPKNIEVAVEVALGGDLQDVVTKTVDQAQKAIKFLKEKNRGRATFLPLDFLHTENRSDRVEAILGRPGVLGLARNLVEFDPAIASAVQYLFGNTVIVETLEVAVALEREGHRHRYVSLQGDVVNPRGVLSGGSHQTRGLLSRGREIKQLRETLEQREGELSRARKSFDEARDRASSLQTRAAELQTALHHAQLDEARAEKDQQQADSTRREQRNRLAQAQARGTQQRVDRQKHEDAIAAARRGLDELLAKIVATEADIASQEAAAGERAAAVQALSETVSRLREETSALRERVGGMKGRIAEATLSIEQAGRDREVKMRESAALAKEKDELSSESADADAREAELAAKLEDVDKRLSASLAEQEMATQALRKSSGEMQSTLRERNERDNAVRELDVKVAELKAQLEFLEREAEDEFGVPVSQIVEDLQREQAEETQRHADAGAEAGEEEPEPVTLAEDDLITDERELRTMVAQLRDQVQRMGAVNEGAIEEYATQKERLTFLTSQRDDLIAAKDSLSETIRNIDETTKRLFDEAFGKIRANFVEMFRRLFGGKGDLILVEQEGQPEPGIEIFAQPAGKAIGGNLTLMSGGEKALTSIALMLSLFQFRPSPICILDEIDAPLDDTNVSRFCDVVRDFSKLTQFLIITHNKITMALADTIYGVTMQEPGISKVVSVRFEEAEEAGLLDDAPAV